MNLKVSSLVTLKPHEDVLVDEVKRIKDSLLSSGVQKKPLIVDAETGVIIDGAHRFKAMLEIGLKYAVIYSVDYANPEIVVKRWIPCSSIADLTLLKEAENLDLKPVDHKTAILSVDEYRAPFALLTKEGGYLSTRQSASTLAAYWSGWRLFRRLAYATLFASDSERIEEVLKRFTLLLYRPALDKKDVVNSALSGELYPPKSTRHVLPFEPKDICFRLLYLKGE